METRARGRAFARVAGTVMLLGAPTALVLGGGLTGTRLPVLVACVAAPLLAALACRARGRAAPWPRSRGRRAWTSLAAAQGLLAVAVLAEAAGDTLGSGETVPPAPAAGAVAVVAHVAGALGLGLAASGVCLLLPPAARSRSRSAFDTAVVVLAWAVVAQAVAVPTAEPGTSDWVEQALGVVLAVLLASGSTLLVARGAAPGALPFRVGVPVAVAGLALAAHDVVGLRADSPVVGGLLVTGAAALLLRAARVPAEPSAPPTRGARDADATRAEHLAALAPYVATAPAGGTVLAAAVAHGTVPPVTTVTAVVLAALWLASSLVARWDAVSTVRALRDRVDAETLARGVREKWFRSLVQSSSDVITVVDPDGRIRFQTPSAAHILGHEPTSLVGTNFGALLRAADAAQLVRALAASAAQPWSVTTVGFSLRRGDGQWVETETTITSLVSDPDIHGVVLNTRDVSERRQLEQQLARQAYADSLTGLANRLLFRDRVERALTGGGVGEVAVLFCDLNGFKAVNDSLGHAAGDALLRLVAERLRRCVRPDDVVARLGGDEFAVLLTGDGAEQSATWVAGRVRRALDGPFHLHGRDVRVTTSTGIAVADTGAEDAEQLLRNADLAMYRAKADPDLDYVRFERSMHEALLARVQVESDLRQAVARGQLALHYQPVVDLATGDVVGAEALMRWHHAERGLVLPDEFIGVAEETGLVGDIGAWALGEACRQASRWQCHAIDGRGFHVAVNMSARQVNEVTVGHVEELLARSDVPPAALTLEVTESALMARDDAAVLLRRLKGLGVRLAVDDFGTGYSSLSYLSRFPVDVLKIDRSFVADVGQEAGAAPAESVALARSIVQLGRSLRLTTVAEGIETPEQHEVLRSMGCALGQGYLFSPAVPADAFEEMLRARRGPHVVPA